MFDNNQEQVITINVFRKTALFSVYCSYPCFSGALILRKNKIKLSWLFLIDLLQF